MRIPDPEIVFEGVKPEKAIEYWKSLSRMTAEQAKKLDAGARSRAFYVSCLKEMDEIALVHTAIGEALEKGTTFDVFREHIARLGLPDYLAKTIFTTNLQTAYAAGRYAKMQAVKKTRPYWRYLTLGDNRVRPSHAVLNGMVFPADHPFWNENHPPNGFRCRCGVQTLSERQVKREKLTIQKEMPGDMMWTDPKTGMEYHVARPGADDGFRNNPGATGSRACTRKRWILMRARTWSSPPCAFCRSRTAPTLPTRRPGARLGAGRSACRRWPSLPRSTSCL